MRAAEKVAPEAFTVTVSAFSDFCGRTHRASAKLEIKIATKLRSRPLEVIRETSLTAHQMKA
jgi:hypothetical protein